MRIGGQVEGSVEVRSAAQLGAAVRGARQAAGLTQQQLAERARVSRRWVGELENGKARVEWHLVLAVVQALGLTIRLEPDQPRPSTDALADAGEW